MRDNYGRDIRYLRLSVTDFCNLRCLYCMPEEGVTPKGHEEILSVEEIVEIVETAVGLGLDKVRLTGGEPLVRRGIMEICRRVGAIAGIRELCMTTNGVLLDQYAEPLRAAGVDRVNISLDTLNPDRFAKLTRGGDLQRVLDGLAAAERAGLTPIKLNVVLIGGKNDDEIEDFVRLTEDKNIHVRFIELMPIGESASWDRESFMPGGVVLERCPELMPVEGSSGGVDRLFTLPGGRGRVGLISPMSRHFCAQCNRVRVTADGKLKPCLHSDREIPLKGLGGADLREAMAQGILGKPISHHMAVDRPSESHRNMHQIGG